MTKKNDLQSKLQVVTREVFTFRPELGKRDPAGGLATG
jgi:hypothetical protein